MWFWIWIGLGAWVVLSVVAGFAFAAVLGRIGRELSTLTALYEPEFWATRPVSRAIRVTAEPSRERATPVRSPRVAHARGVQPL
jgi:hypothetical protein